MLGCTSLLSQHLAGSGSGLRSQSQTEDLTLSAILCALHLLSHFLTPARLFSATDLKTHLILSSPAPNSSLAPHSKALPYTAVCLLHQDKLILLSEPSLLTFLSPNVQPGTKVLSCTPQMCSPTFYPVPPVEVTPSCPLALP